MGLDGVSDAHEQLVHMSFDGCRQRANAFRQRLRPTEPFHGDCERQASGRHAADVDVPGDFLFLRFVFLVVRFWVIAFLIVVLLIAGRFVFGVLLAGRLCFVVVGFLFAPLCGGVRPGNARGLGRLAWL